MPAGVRVAGDVRAGGAGDDDDVGAARGVQFNRAGAVGCRSAFSLLECAGVFYRMRGRSLAVPRRNAALRAVAQIACGENGIAMVKASQSD